MHFAVRLLRRRGRMLPWREVVNHPPLVGDLRIEEIRDGALHRYIRTARLFRDMEILHRDDRPTLYDVHIVAMSPQAFTLAGFERVEEAEYAQSWLVQAE
jgi:hypothetical protein